MSNKKKEHEPGQLIHIPAGTEIWDSLTWRSMRTCSETMCVYIMPVMNNFHNLSVCEVFYQGSLHSAVFDMYQQVISLSPNRSKS